jgi:hypothetical protein
MIINSKIATIVACCVMIALPLNAWAASTKTRAHHRHHVNRHKVQRNSGCPVYKNAEGELVDCRGWRKTNGGWDNTCFNLPYLLSRHACSLRGDAGI